MLISADRFPERASPPLIPPTGKDTPRHDFGPNTNSDEELDIFSSGGIMTGTGDSSPFIKDEPDDWNFNSNQFMNNQNNYNMQSNQAFDHMGPGSIDPSELTMQNGTFGQYSFGSQQNLSSSFHMGNSGIGDDELLDLDLNDTSKSHAQMHNQFTGGQSHGPQENGHMHGFSRDLQGAQNNQGYQNQGHQIFSSTPDGAPIQSPFTHNNFNYGQFMASNQLSQHVSPYMRPVSGNGHVGSFDNNYLNRQMPNLSHAMERKPSDSRSPLTPKTPALGGLNLGGTPDSGNFPSQPIHANNLAHRHQKSLSGHWDSTSGSLHSYVDSPIVSPSHANHAQISEILKSGKHASLPAKVDGTHHQPGYQSQEAKRRRRRESHNMVERRRRDNINERIQELSHLVPQHRLEDEKVRKHLANNSPLSPTLAATTGMSPPAATSLLAGGGGRRATGAGNITMGIPIEEKDKGPNKGDILNGSVGWTRDLMWALHIKMQQEAELAKIIHQLGGKFPFSETEDEKRMRTELLDAMEKNDPSTFEYTRAHGTGLRVPKHTTVAGEPLQPMGAGGSVGGHAMGLGGGALSPQSLSPGVQGAGGAGGLGQGYWARGSRGLGFTKEEDEYGMEMS